MFLCYSDDKQIGMRWIYFRLAKKMVVIYDEEDYVPYFDMWGDDF